jgi:hypothetical protein
MARIWNTPVFILARCISLWTASFLASRDR